MKFKAIAAVAAFSIASPCFATNNIDQLQNLGQAEFKAFSQDLGAALSYKAVSPAEPLGITGFDIGLEVTGTKLKHSSVWDKASSGSAPSTVPVPKLHVIKGLPLNFDVGAIYTKIPSTNISLLGGELRYAIMEGGVATPAVAIRGTFTKLSGVNQLDFSTKGLELSVSKGFAIFTPYAGVGEVWVDSKPKAEAVTIANLNDEKFQQTKYFVGTNINFGLLNIDLDYDNTDSTNSYTLKLGWRF